MKAPYKSIGDCNESSAVLTGEDGLDKATLCRITAKWLDIEHGTLSNEDWQRMVCLVDSAPDLLEALEAALVYVPQDGDRERDVLDMAIAAIAKARGNG